jgi:hypothetical protein
LFGFFGTTAADGKQDEVAHYNLDMILALGFRMRSPVGMRFRQWPGGNLDEYIVKGLDNFHEPTSFLQDIRTSERRFRQRITDIYATSIDYDADHPLTHTGHSTIYGQIAAVLIAACSQSNMLYQKSALAGRQ